ncbi:MAG: hypothetical protein ACREPX_09680, partial [Rhodanobacteraceae bacterium]
PEVDPQFLHASPVDQADILIVGDSFSMTFRWQSVLTRAGYRVTTIYWAQLKETLCDDFDAWVDRAGFRGKLVVIESVERLLPERVENMRTCKKMQAPFEYQTEPFFTYPDKVPGFSLNWKAKLTSGLTTYKNTRQAKATENEVLSAKKTWVRPVAEGCTMFSHLLCNKALFFRDDDKNRELTEDDVAELRAFSAAQTERPILWMVIPNKTTTYVKPDHSRDFVAAFERSDLGPELFAFALKQKTQIRDFYFPNDTHLSMFGQLVLGERMLEAVRKIIPPPAHTDAPITTPAPKGKNATPAKAEDIPTE